MKFLCVVLLLSSLIAIGTALVQPWVQPASVVPDPICQVDSECSPSCFCYKQGKRQQRGQCVCTMDLKVLNECTKDRECIERDSHRGRPGICSCYRDSSLQPTGQCECINYIG